MLKDWDSSMQYSILNNKNSSLDLSLHGPLVGSEPASGCGREAAAAGCGEQGSHRLGSYRIIDKNSQNPLFWNRNLIIRFKEYLISTSKCTFINHGLQWDCENPPTEVEDRIGYIHRWTPIYRKSVIAKMYLLEKWHKDHPLPITMGTFTTYQNGEYSRKAVGNKTIEAAFQKLKQSWTLVRMQLRFYHPEISFVYFYEPHESGYPHLHVIFFGELPLEIQEKIKHLWSEKYQAGSYEHGVDFTPIEHLKSVRNYVIKYMSKILRQDKIEEWTGGELLFNAVMWKNKFRLWGASRDLSKAMMKPVIRIEGDEDLTDEQMTHEYYWTYTELQTPENDTLLIRKREGYQIPGGGDDDA